MSYGKVHDVFWDDDKIEALSDRAAMLALFLITGRHRNAIGCFKLGLGAITDIPRFGAWGIEGVSKALRELSAMGFHTRDFRTGWTFITNTFKHDPIKGDKAAIHAAKLAMTVPTNSPAYAALKSKLEPEITREFEAAEKRKKPFTIGEGWPMRSVIEGASEGVSNGHTMPEPSPYPSPEPEPQPEPSEANASGADAPLPSKSEIVSRETADVPKLSAPDEGELLDLPDALRRPGDPWRTIYAGFKAHLGTRSGGLISKIRGVSNLGEMRGWLDQLDRGEIADGHEYFGKIIANRVAGNIRAGAGASHDDLGPVTRALLAESNAKRGNAA